MVDGQQQIGLQQLALDGGRPDGQNGLIGKDGGSLRHREDIPGKLKVRQVVQEPLIKHFPAPKILDILGLKVEVLDVLDDLLQPSRNGIPPFVRYTAEEQIKMCDPVLVPGLEVSVAHGQLIKVAQHGHVQFLVCIHGKILCFSDGAFRRPEIGALVTPRAGRSDKIALLYAQTGDKSIDAPAASPFPF